MTVLIHDVVFAGARRAPADPALVDGPRQLSYADLAGMVAGVAGGLLAHGLPAAGRVAVYLEKNLENVAAMFGAAAAGGVFVPVNPQLKAAQVAYILADCAVQVLVTSAERLRMLAGALDGLPSLKLVVVTGALGAAPACKLPLLAWDRLAGQAPAPGHRRIDADMAAILYTSGSTGSPKGVVLSHRNLVAGAGSVASYLGNGPHDRILAVLPLSFDYGLSQLTTAFHSGACAVLLNYLLPRDILRAVREHAITGLGAVPALWNQLARLSWPDDCSLRYLTNSGGAMPRPTLDALRRVLPAAQPYLMYGLTEAFRSTYLPPAQLDARPDSIGRAIPNAEIRVLRPDGSECAPGEPGELVHRGALVALGYWNDPARTAQRFRPIPAAEGGLPLPELAVWSGDTVRRDEEGYLYFISRNDEMIKTSGFRVSPSEVEDVAYACPGVAEAAAFGAPHPELGQAIVLVASGDDALTRDALLAWCKRELPGYMAPALVELRSEALPRNPNGKLDRSLLRQQYHNAFMESTQ